MRKQDSTQTSRTKVDRVLVPLLTAALDDSPVDRLRTFLNSDPAFVDRLVNRLGHRDWTWAAISLPKDQLRAVIELVTLAEESLPDWGRRGSASPVTWLFNVYSQKVVNADDLAEWILSHSTNGYVPFGSWNLGARSLAELQKRRNASLEEKASRADEEAQRHEEARRRRAAKATTNIFGAICRGDIKAVRALQMQGADLSARDELGRTPIECAVELDRAQIAQLLRGSGEE